MFQQTVKTVRIKSPKLSLATRTRQWREAAEVVKLAAVCGYPLRDFQPFVDDCIAKGVACEATLYERREAISNAVYNTGYHVDRTDKVCLISDLVGLRDVSLGTVDGRPCIRFKVVAQLGYGTEYLSAETFEWLSESGTPVINGRRLDVHVEPLVEAAYGLDAYMTDVAKVVYSRLEEALPELRLRERVSVLVIQASEAKSRVVFDIFVDGKWGSACVEATLVSPESGFSKVAFGDQALAAISRVASDIAADPSVVRSVVRQMLEHALWHYEYWNDDAERERAEMERDSA